jgi:hypothetical protein
MKYFKIRENNKQFLALTTLHVSEFDELLPRFEMYWDSFINRYKFDGTPRLRKYTPKDTTVLQTIGEKLFFILYYQKNNPLQEALAAAFDMEQDMANKWIHALTPILQKALTEYRAARTAPELATKLVAGQDYIGDATEREIQRPIQNQEENWQTKMSHN